MKKHRRKVRYEAYRDIRRAESEERRRQNGKITLAPVSLSADIPILKSDKRRHVLEQMIDVLKDWRQSPFEHEAATISGLRTQFCLEGYGWHRSDRQARGLVDEGLKRIGAKRPTYDQGQREHTERDGACVWCGGEIEAGDNAYGRTGKFCSVDCAKSARFHRAEEWDLRTSAIARAAAATISREAIDPVSCLHCAKLFKPLAMDARGRKFCSHECAGAFRRKIPERQCENCSRIFQPYSRGSRYCSKQCHGQAQRTLHPKLCQNPVCATMFRPRDKEQKFCCTECSNAVGPEAKHPRVCVWCQTPFMGKHPTSTFCSSSCKSMEYQFRTGRKRPKWITPRVFDYTFRMAA